MISGESATVCESYYTIYLLVGSGIRKVKKVYGSLSSRTGVLHARRCTFVGRARTPGRQVVIAT
jgi:hypothetical protein